jgi:hypothetical protein
VEKITWEERKSRFAGGEPWKTSNQLGQAKDGALEH